MATTPLPPHGSDASLLDAALADFRWKRLRVTLRNTRQAHAAEHPLFVFKAIFLHASRRLPGVDARRDAEPWRPYVFHPAGRPLPNRLRRDGLYEIDLCFHGTEADPEATDSVSIFAADLVRHLANPSNNFSVEQLEDPVEESIPLLGREVLEGAWPELDPAAEEVCLDFLTPFRWNRPSLDRDAKIRWRFRADQLKQYLARRAAQLLPGDLTEPRILAVIEQATAGSDLETLPYYWHFEEAGHRPKTHPSMGGSRRQAMIGMAGPLYLRGKWITLLPLLLLASRWHLGNKITQFQGACRLDTDRSTFDAKLCRQSLYEEALAHFEANSDAADDLAQSLLSREELLVRLREDLSGGHWTPRPARSFRLPKPGSEETRPIALLDPVDQVAHRALHDAL
ncbi:MAG: hypothetical protein KDM63_18025, partial [Verrucomicrobiae bacterium]|nr:hypothetical protein [Verrucomicrobiae bacterium]